MKKTSVTITVTDNVSRRTTTHVLRERDLLSEIYSDYDGVMDAISGDVLARLKKSIMKAAKRELGGGGRNANGDVIWRLELHDTDGLHWSVSDEHKPNTHGWRTIITCTSDEFDEIDQKAEDVWKELKAAHGKVEYLDFYKAMNE